MKCKNSCLFFYGFIIPEICKTLFLHEHSSKFNSFFVLMKAFFSLSLNKIATTKTKIKKIAEIIMLIDIKVNTTLKMKNVKYKTNEVNTTVKTKNVKYKNEFRSTDTKFLSMISIASFTTWSISFLFSNFNFFLNSDSDLYWFVSGILVNFITAATASWSEKENSSFGILDGKGNQHLNSVHYIITVYLNFLNHGFHEFFAVMNF